MYNKKKSSNDNLNQSLISPNDEHQTISQHQIIEVDEQGREAKSTHFRGDKKTKVRTYEYDEFGKLKRIIETALPSEKMHSESIYYYSTKFKLDSSKHISGNQPNKYQSTIYFYDDRGLKEKEVYTDRLNHKVMVTRFKYQ